MLGRGRILSTRKTDTACHQSTSGVLETTLGEREDCDNSLRFLLKTSSALGYNLGVIYLLESVGRKLCSCLLGFCLVVWNDENCPACFVTVDQSARG